jgi:hypothetical protein
VKRLLALAVGLFGLRAILRRRRRSHEPADDLREKLAAQRSSAPDPAPVAAEEPKAPAEPGVNDVDARRADVHAQARQKIDELSG